MSDDRAVAHLPAWPEGVAQPGARSGPAVPDRLQLHLLGLHAGEERGDGRGQRLHRRSSTRTIPRPPARSASRCCRRCSCRPQEIPFGEINRAMDTGKYTFVVDVPPKFQQDLARDAKPEVQIVTDATAMSQAGRGPGLHPEHHHAGGQAVLVGRRQAARTSPLVSLDTRARFNPNYAAELVRRHQPGDQQHLGAGDLPDRRGRAARARARQHRASAGHAAAALTS